MGHPIRLLRTDTPGGGEVSGVEGAGPSTHNLGVCITLSLPTRAVSYKLGSITAEQLEQNRAKRWLTSENFVSTSFLKIHIIVNDPHICE